MIAKWELTVIAYKKKSGRCIRCGSSTNVADNIQIEDEVLSNSVTENTGRSKSRSSLHDLTNVQ